MKKFTLLLLVSLSVMSGRAQTMYIYYKNGQTVQYNMQNIDRLEFTDKNQSNNAQVSTDKAVDLGLSVKWASCNVGATSPEEYGERYAWAETTPKDNYNKSNYAYYDSSTESYIDIGMDIKGTGYDVAHVKWGGSWRMPTYAELDELRDKCDWEWTQYNGINGYLVKGKNGNSIFFPVGGKTIHLWASEIAIPFNNGLGGKYFRAYYIGFASGNKDTGGWGEGREHGNYIRPVTSK